MPDKYCLFRSNVLKRREGEAIKKTGPRVLTHVLSSELLAASNLETERIIYIYIYEL
jgi:hypothetical protein